MSLIRRFLVLTLTVLLAACGSLPPRGEVSTSRALADTSATALARLAASSRPPSEATQSGFRLLPVGDDAFDARLALLRRSERSLDLQYYYIRRDEAGLTLLRELRDAASRGVRIRLLVDDFYAAEIDDLLAGLAANPNAEVRLFNPMPLRRGWPVFRLAFSSGDLQLYNHRMHNKLFVADNAVALHRPCGDRLVRIVRSLLEQRTVVAGAGGAGHARRPRSGPQAIRSRGRRCPRHPDPGGHRPVRAVHGPDPTA